MKPITIATLPVNAKDAPEFGILKTMRLYRIFIEKLKNFYRNGSQM
jgi:hypothetical protein